MDKKLALGILFGVGIFAFIWFMSRRSSSGIQRRSVSQRLDLRPVGSSSSGRRYTNKESWDIAYNSDGLPVKVTISRKAVEE